MASINVPIPNPYYVTYPIDDDEESFMHIGALRYRIVGSGSLKTSLKSLDNVNSATLPVLAMTSSSAIEPTILCNFTSQRVLIRFEVTGLGEWFSINRIVAFAKSLYKMVPQ